MGLLRVCSLTVQTQRGREITTCLEYWRDSWVHYCLLNSLKSIWYANLCLWQTFDARPDPHRNYSGQKLPAYHLTKVKSSFCDVRGISDNFDKPEHIGVLKHLIYLLLMPQTKFWFSFPFIHPSILLGHLTSLTVVKAFIRANIFVNVKDMSSYTSLIMCWNMSALYCHNCCKCSMVFYSHTSDHLLPWQSISLQTI